MGTNSKHCLSIKEICKLYSRQEKSRLTLHGRCRRVAGHPGGTRARRGNSQCLAKSSPYAGPSAGTEVARLRRWHVWCLLGHGTRACVRASHRLASPCLALPGFTMPCLAFPLPCLALPCLALPRLASPYLALSRLTLRNAARASTRRHTPRQCMFGPI